MKQLAISAILLSLFVMPAYAAVNATARSDPSQGKTVKGRVTYRTGPKLTVTGDANAKVWVFRGREALALRSLEKLRQFEQQFPQGLTRVEDRPKENETRMSAMVLMTYNTVHEQSLMTTVPVAVA